MSNSSTPVHHGRAAGVIAHALVALHERENLPDASVTNGVKQGILLIMDAVRTTATPETQAEMEAILSKMEIAASTVLSRTHADCR